MVAGGSFTFSLLGLGSEPRKKEKTGCELGLLGDDQDGGLCVT